MHTQKIVYKRFDARGTCLKVVCTTYFIGDVPHKDYTLQRTKVDHNGLETVLNSFMLSSEERELLNLKGD